YATTALATAPVFYRDRLNTVRVQLWQGVLSSITDDALLAGGNAALLGDELIQFQNATLLGDGYYELSGLHRGLRGTEATTTTHSVGERFVMLDESTIKFLPLDASDLGVSQTYQAVSAGQQMGDAVAQNFSPTGKNLKPLAPAHVRGVRAAGTGTDLTLTWVRRNRRDFSWRDGVDVALDDDAESYVVQIMNGTSVIREFSPTTPAQVYTAAQQGADWGTVPATLTVRVAQISARVGAGAYAQAIV
ncbi:MAG: hypothetical protein EB121_00475, partial [Alphaproteobacteria bacterium]|nr:hypothetical protein [Alphaproteobacteria bacterium]